MTARSFKEIGTQRLVAAIFLCGPAFGQQLCEVEEIHASDPSSFQRFGADIDIDMGRLVVGAPGSSNEDGGAYLYDQNGLEWVNELKFSPDPAFTDKGLGHQVAIDGGLIVASATSESSSAMGAAYIFEDNGSGFTRTRLSSVNGASDDFYGSAVAVEGDIVAIGSQNHPNPVGEHDGAVYVYQRQGVGWILQQQLFAPGPGINRSFGSTLAIVSGTLVVGLEIGPLIACTYELVAGTWTLNQQIPRPHAGGASAMAAEGSRLIIGSVSTGSSGAIYIFDKTGNNYQLTGSILQTPSGGPPRLGSTVALAGTNLIVGTMNLPSPTLLYHLGNGAPSFRARLTSGDRFSLIGAPAKALAAEGTTLLVGTTFDHDAGNTSGAVYMYEPAYPTPGSAFCFCPGSSAPCGNSSPDTGCINADGVGALMSACRTDRVSLDNLVISVRGATSFSFGLIYMGPNQASSPFSNGIRCIAGSLLRFPVQNASSVGFLSIGPGIIDQAANLFGPAGQIAAGDTWQFQAWYRDSAGPCGGHSNFSNALSVTFQP